LSSKGLGYFINLKANALEMAPAFVAIVLLAFSASRWSASSPISKTASATGNKNEYAPPTFPEVNMSTINSGFARIVITVILLIVISPLAAAELSPVGLWKTIDDNSGQPRGLVRIREINGRFEGRIEKIFPKPGDDPAPKCDKCDGTRHNQPVLGMTILSGLTKQGEEYQGGEILDPETGKIYRVKMKVAEGGKKLEVRGFIGVSLFGRSQIWLREE
jgi:uncharacterized protein (DUF2147 family)